MADLFTDWATATVAVPLAFRIIFLVLFVLVVIPYLWTAVRANLRGEKITQSQVADQEGRVFLMAFKLTDVAKILGLIVWLIEPAWMAWSSVPLPGWVRWTGIAVGVVMGLWMSWVCFNLADNHTLSIVIREKHALVTSGPYRWVRHPMYTATLLGTPVLGLVTGNWFITGAMLSQFLLLALIKVPLEEARLIERFGEDYRQYMGKTKRFVPLLW